MTGNSHVSDKIYSYLIDTFGEESAKIIGTLFRKNQLNISVLMKVK